MTFATTFNSQHSLFTASSSKQQREIVPLSRKRGFDDNDEDGTNNSQNTSHGFILNRYTSPDGISSEPATTWQQQSIQNGNETREKRRSNAPLKSHLEGKSSLVPISSWLLLLKYYPRCIHFANISYLANTLRLMKQGQRLLAQKSKLPPAAGPVTHLTCQDCDVNIPVYGMTDETHYQCVKCQNVICERCSIKAPYESGSQDCVLCLRCTRWASNPINKRYFRNQRGRWNYLKKERQRNVF